MARSITKIKRTFGKHNLVDQNEKYQTLRMKSVRMITHDLREKVRKDQEEEGMSLVERRERRK